MILGGKPDTAERGLNVLGHSAEIAPAELHVTSMRRDPRSRVISLGVGATTTSAAASNGTIPPPGVCSPTRRISGMLARTSGLPHTTTSNIFWSSKISPTLVPCTSVVAARRTSAGETPMSWAFSGRYRTSIRGTSTWACTFRSATPSILPSAAATFCASVLSVSRSGPKILTTIVALAPVSTSFTRSRRYVSRSR